MGCCTSEESKSTKSINDELNNVENNDHITNKLLFLGPGASGKSTLLRQMRKTHGEDFEDVEYQDAIKPIHKNVIETMRVVAIYSELLSEEGNLKCKVKPELESIRVEVAQLKNRQPFTRELYEKFNKLYTDEGIQETLKYSDFRYQILDNYKYLFENMERFSREDFLPTYNDLLYTRRRTTGVNKVTLKLHQPNGNTQEIYKIYDVGGQRNERRKWVQCFDDVNGLIFVSALSSYNQTLFEDVSVNKMKEALALFKSVVNLDAFEQSEIILFLNKNDLYIQKIKKVKISDYFDDYKGKDYSYEDGLKFFKTLFKKQIKTRYKTVNDKEIEKEPKNVYCHVTTATDQKNVKNLFSSVRIIVIKEELGDMGFL